MQYYIRHKHDIQSVNTSTPDTLIGSVLIRGVTIFLKPMKVSHWSIHIKLRMVGMRLTQQQQDKFPMIASCFLFVLYIWDKTP